MNKPFTTIQTVDLASITGGRGHSDRKNRDGSTTHTDVSRDGNGNQKVISYTTK